MDIRWNMESMESEFRQPKSFWSRKERWCRTDSIKFFSDFPSVFPNFSQFFLLVFELILSKSPCFSTVNPFFLPISPFFWTDSIKFFLLSFPLSPWDRSYLLDLSRRRIWLQFQKWERCRRKSDPSGTSDLRVRIEKQFMWRYYKIVRFPNPHYVSGRIWLTTHRQHWGSRGTRRRNICTPKSCGSSGLRTDSRSAASSSASSRTRWWCPGRGPSSAPRSCPPPSSSTASVGHRIGSPGWKKDVLLSDCWFTQKVFSEYWDVGP